MEQQRPAPVYRAVTVVVPYGDAQLLITETEAALSALKNGSDEVRITPGERVFHYPEGNLVERTGT